ncbi:MAG: class I SAM-dependent methyltransferase [Planctomycetota bacterium]|jgi:2-polyprenyl-3-methyl-5-hydroxy-6-metoxy-1,4-benzoquinol methylase
MSSDEQMIANTWSTYWEEKRGDIAQWDVLSHTILGTLRREIRGFEGKTIMEAGCGTGRISARVCQEGASVACLDIASEALDLARAQFPAGAASCFVLGSILSMPRDRQYDALWNAGVLEHFSLADQRQAIGEFLDVLQSGGKLVLFTPYAGSVLYRAAKFLLERTGRWPYGRETPVSTLRHVIPDRGILKREYTVSFLSLLLDSYKWFRPLRPVCCLLRNVLLSLAGERGFARLDRISSWLFGGYLLVSIVEPREEDGQALYRFAAKSQESVDHKAA